MTTRLRLPSRDYLGLTLFWFAVHLLAWVWLLDGRHFHWEIVQAKKVLDYGFWNRGGAMLGYGMYAGILPNPAEFNYINHPYLIFWFYALLMWLFGKVAVYAFVGALGLAGCLMTYHFLRSVFPRNAAWFAAALLVAAHATIEFATNTDDVAQSAIIWPAAVAAILALKNPQSSLFRAAPWLLGLAVFLSGQIFWLAYSTLPVLMLLCLPEDMPLSTALRRPWAVRGWVPILLGAALSSALYLTEIVIYTPSLHGNTSYLGTQLGLGGSFLAVRLSMLPVLVMRLLLAGPALWLGALVCLPLLKKQRPERRLAGIMLVYFVLFGLFMFAVPRFLFLNQHGFRFMLFPCAFLTAYALAFSPARWLRVALVLVAVPSLVFCHAKLREYRASVASMTLGTWLGQHTKPQELVFSNIRRVTPPIQAWDIEFETDVALTSDRYFRLNLTNETKLKESTAVFQGQMRDVCFLYDRAQPLAPELAAELETNATPVSGSNLAVPKEGFLLFKAARKAVWSLLGKNAPYEVPVSSPGAGAATAFDVELYRLAPDFVRRLNEGRGLQAASP